MAHQIEKMVFFGKTPWHCMGTALDDADLYDWRRTCVKAGLDWDVELTPLVTADTNAKVTHRAVRRTSDNRILGVVGPKYHVLQNKDAFKWFQPFLDAREAALHTAGSLCEGSRVWVLAKLNRAPLLIAAGDEVEKFVLLSHGHDGSLAVRVSPTKLRGITERTLSLFGKGLRERKKTNGSIGLAPITLRNYLVALRKTLKWAVQQKLLPELPAFPAVKVPKKKPQPIPQEDFDKLLEKAPDQLWRAYLLCAWWGGLRLSEARHLRWEKSEEFPWLDLVGSRIVLPAVFVKSAEDQWVPLHPELRKALEALPKSGDEIFPFRSRKGGGPLSRTGITNRIITMARRAGIKLSMHRLRKGFGCRVAKQLGKGNAPILHRLMRHSSMQVTMDYYASVDDALQDAIDGLV